MSYSRAEIQTLVETCLIHLIGKCSSGVYDQIDYSEVRAAEVKRLQQGVLVNGQQYRFRLRFFSGEYSSGC